ncbi:MAG: hypothetical protein LC772_12155, partial [Chloroflexi bacterium]|nr:hypothetical protein [Chloroflexota bacterium]
MSALPLVGQPPQTPRGDRIEIPGARVGCGIAPAAWRLLFAAVACACTCLPVSAQAAPQAAPGVAPQVYDLSSSVGWESPQWGGAPPLVGAPQGGLELSLPAGRPWAAVTQQVTFYVSASPVLAVRVESLTPGASWLLKVDNSRYDPAHPRDFAGDPAGGSASGLYLINLGELGGWTGRQEIEIRLFVTGPPGARVRFRRIALLAPSFAGTFLEHEPALAPALRSGRWVLQPFPAQQRLLIGRAGAAGAVSVKLPGGADARLDDQKTGGTESDAGHTVLFRSVNAWARFETRLSTGTAPDGLFHWTVDVELTRPHAIGGCDPECEYVLNPALAPVANAAAPIPEAVSVIAAHHLGQKGMETGQAFLPADAAMGGSALYVANFSALNRYFELTHT